MTVRIETRINRIAEKAARAALKELTAEAKAVLPEGWRIVIAVGWGLSATDPEGRDVANTGAYGFDGMRKGLPKGVRPLIKACATFHDVFGPGNEILTSKGLSYPK